MENATLQLQELLTQWLTPTGAARRLGVSVARVHQLMAEGKLSCLKTPLGRLVDPKGVDQIARERRQKVGKKGRIHPFGLRVIDQ